MLIDAQLDVVEALHSSGLAPELPLVSPLKLASNIVVWAERDDARGTERPINANRQKQRKSEGIL